MQGVGVSIPSAQCTSKVSANESEKQKWNLQHKDAPMYTDLKSKKKKKKLTKLSIF